MKKNMGSMDRVARFFLMLLIIGLYVSGTITGVFASVLLIFALVLAITMAFSICPLYSLLGINTCNFQKNNVI